ncbi:MAG: beta-mannosidase, partial [Bacteroidales bacterium]|nr:beta-mannosidase [Bacteroidales bacterium]
EWWTKTLLPVLIKYPVTYVLTWRNAFNKKDHFFAPYPFQISANDFIEFYKNTRTVFCNDLKIIRQDIR